MVGVEQGRVVAVRGDEASPVNKGLLCVKGYHLPGLLYGEDRLLYPQRRNADGSFATHLVGRGPRSRSPRDSRTRWRSRARMRWRCTGRGSGRCSTATPR